MEPFLGIMLDQVVKGTSHMGLHIHLIEQPEVLMSFALTSSVAEE